MKKEVSKLKKHLKKLKSDSEYVAPQGMPKDVERAKKKIAVVQARLEKLEIRKIEKVQCLQWRKGLRRR